MKLKALPNVHKLGIMGGTFDPIHTGHLMIAELLRSDLSLDAVLFIPAGTPRFKQGMQGASSQERYTMCELAVQGNDAFFCSDIELARPGVTYTIDTLRELKTILPSETQLFFITGADAIATLPTWKDAPHIVQLAQVVATSREGYSFEKARDAIEAAHLPSPVLFHYLPEVGISSSYIKKRLAEGKSVRYLVPDPVHDFIVTHHLYQN